MPRAVNGWKVCSRCRRELPVADFARHRRRCDGLNTWCRKCVQEYDQKKGGLRPAPVHNMYQFIEDWPRMPLKDLAVKYMVSEPSVRMWAYWLKKHGHNLPTKHHTFSHERFVRDAQTMTTMQLSEKHGISRNTVYTRRHRLRQMGYTFPTDDHHNIGKRHVLRSRQKKYDRKRFTQLCKKYSTAFVAQLEGISYETVVHRASQCRKEGWR